MPKQNINFFRRFLPAGSLILAFTTLGSYLVGLLRDRIFAQTFGASRLLDAYNAAFILPDFVFNILVASGIAAAFVPIFTELLKNRLEKSREYAHSIITASLGVMLIFSLVVILFAKQAVALIAPGFSPSENDLVAGLLRILAISPLFFAVSNALGAMLVAQRRFLFYGLSPIFYNLGIIGGIVFLFPLWGINGVAVGTLVGGFLHLAVRILDAYFTGFRFRFGFSFRTPEFKKTISLMIPKMFGHPVELAIFWGFTALASHLAVGSIAILNFARNFQSVPVSIVGIAIATAVFPSLSESAAEKALVPFKSALRSSFWSVFVISLLSALLILFIREPLVAWVLGGKAFGAEAIKRTAAILGAFCLSIPTEASSQVLARAFYATKNTGWPVFFSLVSLLIAVGGGWLLLPGWGLMALPLTFALGSILKLILLFALLPRRWKFFDQ